MRRIDHDLAKERGAVVKDAISESGMTIEEVAAVLHYADPSTIHRKNRADGSSYSDTDCDNLAPHLRVRPEYLKQSGDIYSNASPTEEILEKMNAFGESVTANAAKDQLIFKLTGYEVARISEVNGCVLYKPGECIKTTDAHLDRIIEDAQSAAQSAVRIKSF